MFRPLSGHHQAHSWSLKRIEEEIYFLKPIEEEIYYLKHIEEEIYFLNILRKKYIS
jgi:hypothetical protein